LKRSIIKEKSFAFALEAIDLYKILKAQKEYIISKQLLRSATSIGANVNEALAGESRADFVHKMSIASTKKLERLCIG
jgi:four helix bundle protein